MYFKTYYVNLNLYKRNYLNQILDVKYFHNISDLSIPGYNFANILIKKSILGKTCLSSWNIDDPSNVMEKNDKVYYFMTQRYNIYAKKVKSKNSAFMVLYSYYFDIAVLHRLRSLVAVCSHKIREVFGLFLERVNNDNCSSPLEIGD